ncbi:MAG: YdcH family protein [Vicinamibacterales bacterium]
MADAELQLDGLTASLFQHDDAFRQLVSEHHALDQHLHHLSALGYLSREEQYEEAALKKRKLALKDRIVATVREQSRPGS